MRSLPDNQSFAQTLVPAVRTATANGATVQTGADSDARAALLNIGLWTNGTHKFTFERSVDGSAWVVMLAAELDDPVAALDTVDFNSVNVVNGTNDNQIIQIGLLTTDEFVRVVQTISGASGQALLAGATIQNGHPLRVAGRLNPMKPAGLVHALP